MIVHWNPVTYDALARPHREWAAEIVWRLPIRSADQILDAGCGTGYMTEIVAGRLQTGCVAAVDVCLPMLKFGSQPGGHLWGPRIRAINGDLLSLPIRDQVIDGVFSNAVFHWILDQDGLFANLFRCLRPGGWLMAQTGGTSNMQSILEDVAELQRMQPYAGFFSDWREPWLFVSIDEATQHLRRAGFLVEDMQLQPRPVAFATPDDYGQYVREIVLRPHFERLPADLQQHFLNAVIERSLKKATPLEVDYCRLNMFARKP